MLLSFKVLIREAEVVVFLSLVGVGLFFQFTKDFFTFRLYVDLGLGQFHVALFEVVGVGRIEGRVDAGDVLLLPFVYD